MQYYQTKARCPECSLFFKYAVSEEELEEELGQEVFCPRCGEVAVFGQDVVYEFEEPGTQ